MVEKQPPRNAMARAVENMLGIILIFAGIASFGGLLAALGGGFEGWAIVAGIAVIVLFGAGIFAIRDGAKRRAREAGPVVYAPDNTDKVFDVDPNTGERSEHRE